MTPEEYERFKADLEAFHKTPGYDLERRIVTAEMIRYTYAENAVELEGALLAFQRPEMHPLMFEGNQEKLEKFLMLVARRLYNHLATAVSVAEHWRRLFEPMPPSLSACRTTLLRQIDEFRNQPHYRLSVRLRDHSIHHQLHVMSGHMTLSKTSTSPDPHHGWTPSTEIMLNVAQMKRSTATRRMSRAKKAAIGDPVAALPDSTSLLPLVQESQARTADVAAALRATLLAEYGKYEHEVTKAKEKLREPLRRDFPDHPAWKE